MALYQITSQAKGSDTFDHVSDGSTRVRKIVFKPGDMATNKRAAVDDMYELLTLPAKYQIRAVSVYNSATLSATFKVSVLAGAPGVTASTTRLAAGKFRDYHTGITGASATVRSDTLGVSRPTGEYKKEASLALVCTTASSANETAELTIYVEYFYDNLEGN